MERIKVTPAGLALVAILVLTGCATEASASRTLAGSQGPAAAGGETIAVSDSVAASAQGKGPGKGPKDQGGDKNDKPGKGNNGNVGGNGNKNDKPGKGNSGNGNNGNVANKGGANAGSAAASDNRSGPFAGGLAGWLRNFRGRLFGPGSAADFGGWQLGRFKDAFPFVNPDGWQTQERGDARISTGQWQNQGYVFQLTRSVQVKQQSLQDWLNSDIQRLGLSSPNVRTAQADRVQVAVVTGVKDPDYACPVAYVYMWTQNPAGKNQRQAMGVISQAPDTTCNPNALNTFVDAYLAQLNSANGNGRPAAPAGAAPVPEALPSAQPTARPTVAPLVTPATTPVVNGSGWQRSRFFNAFSFAYPEGWTMDRLGDTAHLQGDFGGHGYVMDMVWVRDAPQVGLEQWARADLADLGANLEGTRIDYVSQTGAQVAIATGVRLQGYACPVVRMYVVADNAAAGGQRSYTVTLAQANGQPCDPQALEDLAHRMVQQA